MSISLASTYALFNDAKVKGLDDGVFVLPLQQIPAVLEIDEQAVVPCGFRQEGQVIDLILLRVTPLLLLRVDVLGSAGTVTTPTLSTLSGSTPSHPFALAALIRVVMTFCTLALQEAE